MGRIVEYSADGSPLRMLGTHTDITERKQAEEALRVSEEKFLKAFRSSPDAILLTSLKDGLVIDVNDRTAQIIGYSREELIGRSSPELNIWVNPDDRKNYLQMLQAEKRVIDMQTDLRMKSGEIRTGLISGELITLSSGIHILGTIRDITEIKKNEAALEKRLDYERLLSSISSAAIKVDNLKKFQQSCVEIMAEIVDVSRIYIFEHNHQNDTISNTIEWCSPGTDAQIENLQNVPAQDVIWWTDMMRSNKIIAYNDIKDISDENIKEILGAQNIKSILVVPLFVNEEYYGFLGFDECRTQREWPDEDVQMLLSSTRIITGTIERTLAVQELSKYQKNLEQMVENRTAQLQAVNKELESFSYSVSHDLRAPLRHISGYSSLLKRDLKEPLSEKAAHYLQSINSSANQLGSLIDDLLQFSRTGRKELKKSKLDMNSIIEDSLTSLKPDIDKRDIQWKIASLPKVFGDAALLKLVWQNLLSNAVKFTSKKKSAKIEIGFKKEDNETIFFIRDNGAGFDMRYVEKIFGVFQRLHSAADFEGTGIGLANVYRIILRHEGRIWAKSKPGKGAAFYFTLPMSKEKN